jgi:hypothetical protein
MKIIPSTQWSQQKFTDFSAAKKKFDLRAG